ncbi:hypothetical protein [Mesorhizobium sp. B2-4-17]|uniref:hypothetical protein n=1 Tax=Mesorhizobium sp. B2-4-17 TaxID=2589932 RepID=UPI00112D999F|nr:hypothetical protein [Mesorhizobium sp. B2-4-17]TPK83058.1 hypothetical protein FJ548_19600 [Mesorhizobium sp. B2-4-17]
MAQSRITYSNRAYAKRWLRNLERQNPQHFEILQAIIEEIEDKDGGDIVKADLYRRRPNIAQRIDEMTFDPLPSRGQMLRHNGNGIRHAKFAPSKSIAVVWEKIGDVIYITFDDHAPIRYHRAISYLRDVKLGKPAVPKRARTSGRFMRKLKQFWLRRHFGKLRGFNPRSRFYE